MSLTNDPNDPKLIEGQQNKTGQHSIYLVLSDEERAKGFIRPVRTSYKHVGRYIGLEGGTLEPLPEAERLRYGNKPYVAFLRYPESRHPLVGQALTQEEVDNLDKNFGGCNGITTMSTALAETYARDPSFYGATYCCYCNKHIPVNEFVWVGTDERVGS